MYPCKWYLANILEVHVLCESGNVTEMSRTFSALWVAFMCVYGGEGGWGEWRGEGGSGEGGGDDYLGDTCFVLEMGILAITGKCYILLTKIANNRRELTKAQLLIKWMQWTKTNQMVLTLRPPFSGCPSSVSGKNSGRFASPNYPNNYPNSEDCSWGITVPDGLLVKVEFSHFNTEGDYDKLWIYDGPSGSSSLLVTLTGVLSTPREVISTGSSLWFTFRTDGSFSRRGFEATFTAVDRSTVSG